MQQSFEHRLRWDNVKFEPGELKIIAYKNGKRWAEQIVQTTGKATQLLISADHSLIKADGADLSFITVKVADKNGLLIPDANNKVTFSIEGRGEIAATDNGDPASLISLQQKNGKLIWGWYWLLYVHKKVSLVS